MAMVKEVKLYSFEELAKDVQDKLIEERRGDEIDVDLYSWHEENEKTLNGLARELNVDLISWEYSFYGYDFCIDIYYGEYVGEYIYNLIEEKNIEYNEQWYEEKESELYHKIKDFKGEELQKLLDIMYGDKLNNGREWEIHNGYYLDRIGLNLIRQAYAGELDVTLEELLHMVFDETLKACIEDINEFYSNDEVKCRIKENNGNDYCYLEDGTYVG